MSLLCALWIFSQPIDPHGLHWRRLTGPGPCEDVVDTANAMNAGLPGKHFFAVPINDCRWHGLRVRCQREMEGDPT